MGSTLWSRPYPRDCWRKRRQEGVNPLCYLLPRSSSPVVRKRCPGCCEAIRPAYNHSSTRLQQPQTLPKDLQPLPTGRSADLHRTGSLQSPNLHPRTIWPIWSLCLCTALYALDSYMNEISLKTGGVCILRVNASFLSFLGQRAPSGHTMPYLTASTGWFSVSSCSSPFCLSLSSLHLLSTCCFQLLLGATKAVTSSSEVVPVLGNPWPGRAGLWQGSQLLEEVLGRKSKSTDTRHRREKDHFPGGQWALEDRPKGGRAV